MLEEGGVKMRGILERSIESQQPVQMIYLSKDGSLSQRWIRVLAINEKQIKAYCYLRNKYRVFYLDRILSLETKRRNGQSA
jgi:predicted DNA-binding transcriptional regulator YafY